MRSPTDDAATRTATSDGVVGGAGASRAHVVLLDEDATEVVELRRGLDVSVGRSRSCGLRLDHASVSRKHATLRWDGGPTVRVTDHGSHNGTVVDGRRIDGTAQAGRGAEIAFGSVHIGVVLQRGGPEDEPGEGEDSEPLVARDHAMVRVVALAERAARTDSNILLLGETGAGKEVLAQWIHRQGARSDGPFVAVNCGAIPENLAESSLFGHERGAFTGAAEAGEGYFRAASGGTLFLDEVAELSSATQTKLLRVLEDRQVTPVGSTRRVRVDVRIIAATNHDVDAMRKQGTLRDDLLYRLDVLRIAIPPLRSRPQDIVELARRFLRELTGDPQADLADDAAAALSAHSWPGNVRELRNVIERSVAMGATGFAVRAEDLVGLDQADPGGTALGSRVQDLERRTIVEALEACGGNQSQAARRLGISRRKLIYRLEKHGLKPPPKPQ